MGRPQVQYESGQTAYDWQEMDDSGDGITFEAAFAPFSDGTVVAPYGLLTGGAISPSGSNDEVAVAALTVQAPGMTGADADGVVAVAGGSVSITRGISTDTHCITSITVDSTGALAAVAGTDGTEFVETRGSAGGPPLIPVGSIEIGQVRTTSVTAAPVATSEIMVTVGVHRESAISPGYDIDATNGTVTFYSALPAIHTGAVPRKVYVKGATPLFAPVPGSADWQPADDSVSTSSVETHDGPKASVSFSVGTATFTARMRQSEAIGGDFIGRKGDNLWFKYFPDRDVSTVYQLTQGYLAVSRPFPTSGDDVTVSCTVGARSSTVDVSG